MLGLRNELNSHQKLPKESLSFRLLIDPKGSGAHNMAVDEALLQCVSTSTNPILRFYGFSPRCISLGRFQPIDDLNKNTLAGTDRMDIVRRLTGGRAVLHDDEVTYALILGRQHLHPFSKRNAYRVSATILCELLTFFGIRGIIRQAYHSPSLRVQNPDCFGTTGEYEITTKKHYKLVGSAQTTIRQGTLQHGTIPLSTAYTGIRKYLRETSKESSVTPASIGTETGHSWSYEEALDIFAGAAMTELNGYLDNLTPEETELIQELEKTRYKCKNWTRLK